MTLSEFLKKIINKIPGKRRAIGERTVANDTSKFLEDGKQIEMINKTNREEDTVS